MSFRLGGALPPPRPRREREGASTVSLNHPLTAIHKGSKEKKCVNCNMY